MNKIQPSDLKRCRFTFAPSALVPSILSPILTNEKGQGLTEYIALLVLIAMVSVAATKTLGSTIKAKIDLAQRHIRSDIVIEANDGK